MLIPTMEYMVWWDSFLVIFPSTDTSSLVSLTFPPPLFCSPTLLHVHALFHSKERYRKKNGAKQRRGLRGRVWEIAIFQKLRKISNHENIQNNFHRHGKECYSYWKYVLDSLWNIKIFASSILGIHSVLFSLKLFRSNRLLSLNVTTRMPHHL